MPVLHIVLQGDGILEGTPEDTIVHLTNDITVTALDAGMESGKPSVAFIFKLPDGRTVLAETSMLLFQAAARAFVARFGDLTQ